ncbi:MAG: tRNA (N(6)-L-threonylcarbamoyladenosine(37)-C(2))-methylthiotransferase MtaB [Chloroflexota bacterium]
MNIYLTFLGCKLNQAEIEAYAREIVARGHGVVADPATADWAIVNTCTVTHVAARKSRQLVRHLRQVNPALRLAVTGCYATLSPDEVRALGEVDLILPNADKGQVVERLLLAAGLGCAQPPACGELVPLASGRTRALIKIQEGCDHACTYCIVHVARGAARSRPAEEVLAEARQRAAEGYQELVLTGVNIGAYGRDLDGWSLARLVRALLAACDVPRVRLSSIEPQDVTPELLDLWPHERLCRHVHLPLQSGSDAVLRRMGRPYTAAEFAQVVAALRARAQRAPALRAGTPQMALTTDVLVGFPGETEDDFAATYALLERLALARLHVFRYSRRPGTPAAHMLDQVAPPSAQRRSDALLALGQRLAHAFHARYVGAQVVVLFESSQAGDGAPLWDGLTDNYLRVRAAWAGDLHNQRALVRGLSADAEGLRGEIVQVLDGPAVDAHPGQRVQCHRDR